MSINPVLLRSIIDGHAVHPVAKDAAVDGSVAFKRVVMPAVRIWRVVVIAIPEYGSQTPLASNVDGVKHLDVGGFDLFKVRFCLAQLFGD